MIESQTAPFGTLNGSGNIAKISRVDGALEAVEIGQMNLLESLDEAAAEGEEEEELEEESEVKAAAEANRISPFLLS